MLKYIFVKSVKIRKCPIWSWFYRCHKTTDLSQVTAKLYHIMLTYRVHLACAGFELKTLVVIGTDCTCSCKSNYHAITATATLNDCARRINGLIPSVYLLMREQLFNFGKKRGGWCIFFCLKNYVSSSGKVEIITAKQIS